MTVSRIAPWISWADKPVRACGDCTLCCKVIPVEEIKKKANQWCPHVRTVMHRDGPGCGIYKTRPHSCSGWDCLWTLDDSFGPELQPCIAHVVFDVATDRIALTDVDGARSEREVIQLWVDPSYPEAHRAPAVRAMVAMIAERTGLATLVRFGSSEAFVVVAPVLSSTGDWWEGERSACSKDIGRYG